jgi:hypothetical protein
MIWKWLPEGRLFPVLIADPLECLVTGSSSFLFKDAETSVYSTVNLGFSVPVIRKTSRLRQELTFGAANFSQFDLIRRDNGSHLAGLMNSDFKVSLDYSVSVRNYTARFRIFHLSSHLGDDFVQRHSEMLVNDKSANFEQADLTWLINRNNGYFYAGAGVIYTKYVFRKRFSAQMGGLLESSRPRALNFFMAVDCKLLAENNYNPDVRTMAGLVVSRRRQTLFRIWAEFYNGQLPYSTIDYGRVAWGGAGMQIGR